MTYLDLVRKTYTGRYTATNGDGLTHLAKLGNIEDFAHQRGIYTSCRATLVHVRMYVSLAPPTCMLCLGMAKIPWACSTEEYEGGG